MTGKLDTRNRDRRSDSDDLALLERIARSDRRAMGELYTAWFARLFKFLYRITGDRELTEELINDVMLVVWHKAQSFRGESRVSTWILGIAYRRAAKALSRCRPVTLELVEGDLAVDRLSRTLEQRDWVERALESLSPDHRMTVELVYFEGLSYREIAAVTSCPENTVKTRMFHARRALRDAFRHLRREFEADAS